MPISLQGSVSNNFNLTLPVKRDFIPLIDGCFADPKSASKRDLGSKKIDGVLFFHDAKSMAYRTTENKDTIPRLAYAYDMDQTAAKTARINEVIAESGRKPAEIARAIGIKKQTMNDWTEGRTANPRNEALLDFADEMGVNLRWLISGKGPKYATRDPPEIQRAADLMRVMPQEQQKYLVDFLESSSKAA